ncbi:phosphohydrolase [Sinirhodobacter populi]|uniref:Phosphohydrolase n=1 Tax=Paenirhodobacter populi TaxID=2306993 RepID=A0A443KPY5_9RHOB|nr:phosphohydrolase [Sinirhodobacter populi]RWR34990.1 phosphohydrolase [Sinirhodobacter populi]
MDRPLCLYHGNCADGFTAAWAVWRALGDGVEFLPAHYGMTPPEVTGRDVIMVDFSFKRPVIDALAETCRTMLILDHHATAAEDLARIGAPYAYGWETYLEAVHNAYHQFDRDPRAPFAIFDMNRSGAQIAWDFFHPGEPRPQLVEYVADRDLWRFDLPSSREIAAVLHSHDFDFDMWDVLASMIDRNIGDLVSQGTAIERKSRKDVAGMVRLTRRSMRIGGQVVPVANLPPIMASDAGHLLAEGQPFAASYFDKDGARIFSLRSRQGGADVAAIAAQYGGGGHRNAAGFQAPAGWEGDPA